MVAARTPEPVGPAGRDEVVSARLLGRKLTLELQERLGKLGPCHTSTLHLVSC
jgi:hypothetical protein